jgi:hypothetical protein
VTAATDTSAPRFSVPSAPNAHRKKLIEIGNTCSGIVQGSFELGAIHTYIADAGRAIDFLVAIVTL